jgi:hypothetical protein
MRQWLLVTVHWHGSACVETRVFSMQRNPGRQSLRVCCETIRRSCLPLCPRKAVWLHGGSFFASDRPSPTEAAFAVWHAESDPGVVRVEAISPAPDDLLNFDLRKLPVQVLVLLAPSGTEHLLIGDDACQVRLDVVTGTVLEGPVQFRYDLAGAVGLEAKLLTLQRLVALLRLGRFPKRLVLEDRRTRRWLAALRALDARRGGATHRDIAIALFGVAAVEADWKGRSAYLRCRVQRLIRLGESLVQGGYRNLLR